MSAIGTSDAMVRPGLLILSDVSRDKAITHRPTSPSAKPAASHFHRLRVISRSTDELAE